MIIQNIISVIAQTGPSMSIPGPYWLFTVLHWLILTLHLLAMNFLMGGVLLMIMAKNSPYRKLLFFENIKVFPTVMAATITLGVAPLLFLQVIYGEFFYSASIISGWQWLLIIPVLLVVYYLFYTASIKKSLSDSGRIKLLLISLTGLVFVSFTITMISDLASKPYLWAELYQSSPSGWSLNPSWGQTIFRWIHIMSGALAVAGIIIQLYVLYFDKVKGNRELLFFGGRVFLMGVLSAATAAVIYLLTLEPVVLRQFLHSPGLHVLTTAIVINIIIAFLVYKSSESLSPKPMVLTSAILAFVGVFLMVMTRHYLRLVFLEGKFDPAALQTSDDYSPLIMFLITFVIGLVALFWMLKKYFGSPEKA
ncbi:MAG: hypothetical protein KAR42_01110 [candidate division Zixibacteria bacterium]|nr:hypothetical protein [candidate division Zixibacteria bacterium]